MLKFNEAKFDEFLKKVKTSRRKLCKRIGMNPATMHRTINYSGGDFRVEDLFKIAEALNVDAIHFIEEVYRK